MTATLVLTSRSGKTLTLTADTPEGHAVLAQALAATAPGAS